MMTTESIGQFVNQSTTGRPSEFEIHANSPDTGFISMFFQTSALTVGMTKNGAITMTRTKFCPKIGWFINNATRMPPQTLMTSTHDSDLDRDARLEEAGTDARSALQHAGEMAQPDGLTAQQFADAIAQLRGAAHEVIATVAYKKREYFNAIREYNAAVAEERDADAVVWLRLAVAHDKVSEYELGLADAEKAIANSKAGNPVRELAEQEKARLLELLTVKPAQKQSGISPAPGSGEGSHAN